VAVSLPCAPRALCPFEAAFEGAGCVRFVAPFFAADFAGAEAFSDDFADFTAGFFVARFGTGFEAAFVFLEMGINKRARHILSAARRPT
jgi:hypothetical protein